MRGVERLLRATAKAEHRHFWFQGFRGFVIPLIERALEGCEEPRIVDCGCGTGANLEMLSDFGHACGFDLSPIGLSIGRASGRFRLVRGSVSAAPFSSGTFDLVTSFDVLYALEDRDERAAVAEMFRLARPGGYVLINVAAMNVLRGDHSVLSQEVRRYTRADLRRLVAAAGFQIVRLTYTNFTLFLPLAAIRLAQRWRGLAAGDGEISVPRAPVNAILTGILRLENLWIRRFNFPFGSSLVCLARKPVNQPATDRT